MLDVLNGECEKLGYKPRQVQVEAITFLNEKWNSENKCKVLSLPTGSGKSMIAKTISEYNAKNGLITAIITPQNILIEQYTDEFPALNSLKGKINYPCKTTHTNCLEGEQLERISKKPCKECPYKKAKERTYSENTTIFNPLSYLGFKKLEDCEDGRNIIYDVDTIIVDEFQSLPAMLRELSTIKLWITDIKFQKGVSKDVKNVIQVLLNYSAILTQYICSQHVDKKDKSNFIIVQKKIDQIVYQIKRDESFFVYEEVNEKRHGTYLDCLLVRPKYIHPSVYANFFKIANKVVLMSGTAFPFIWKELGFKDNVDYIDLPSPIPKERRQIFAINSVDLAVRNKEPGTIRLLAEQIRYISENYHPNENGVVLLPYNLAEEVKDYLPEKHFIHMDKVSKKNKINKFKESSEYSVGIFSGSYEGLSLNGNMSRFTIIPKVPYPNLLDKVVMLRKNDSELNYAMETITTIIQAAGRSTRSENDYSYTYILDTNFMKLYGRIRGLIPQYFKESLILEGPSFQHIQLLNNFREEYYETTKISR
jgi:ATP-dependent DNA helicase DinG